jgi:hypothetical protein
LECGVGLSPTADVPSHTGVGWIVLPLGLALPAIAQRNGTGRQARDGHGGLPHLK